MTERDAEAKPLTYAASGVDIAAADAIVSRIGSLARATFNEKVVEHRSRYAGLFKLDLTGISEPTLASTCDGVGTKLVIAKAVGTFSGLGQDLVAMSVNDLLPLGAQPLLFLDYIATGALEPPVLEEIVRGVSDACREVGCVLLGGETAEMPGVYPPGDFDLAGFAVGMADAKRLPKHDLEVGDRVLALASSGIHSNGLSLARAALLDRGGLELSARLPDLQRSLGEELLVPTALYVRPVLELWRGHGFKAAAHITGGGLVGRASKLLEPGLSMILQRSRIRVPLIFELIQQHGDVEQEEMYRTFNMGVGFLAVVSGSVARELGRDPSSPFVEIGRIEAGDGRVELC